jgi:hypothetical protein
MEQDFSGWSTQLDDISLEIAQINRPMLLTLNSANNLIEKENNDHLKKIFS